MDMERYGDYTEFEDDIPKGKNPLFLIIKILIGVVCVAVVGVLAFRMILFNYYPKSMKNIYFTDALTAYYIETDGNIGAKTQDLRFPYDDPEVANFICDNLIVIEATGELQVSARFNTSNIDNVEEKSGLSGLDPEADNLFTFRLYDNNGKIYENPVCVETDSLLMYRYYKVVFDGIDFENAPEWIRIEIFVNGQTDESPFAMVPVYENNVDYSRFSDYELGKEECPS